MSDEQRQQQSKEQEIMVVMRKVLSAIIKDTTPPPGMRHPLSDRTIEDVRACLGLIASREKELAEILGDAEQRPYFTDEVPSGPNVVSLMDLNKTKK